MSRDFLFCPKKTNEYKGRITGRPISTANKGSHDGYCRL